MGLLTLLPLLGIALAVARGARVSAAVGFFLSVAFVILALYVGALAGVLWWTALAVHVFGVALLGYEALRRARGGVPFSIPVPIGVLALLCGWFWIVHGTDQYYYYDEFAHWGVFLKEMLALDGLWTADTNSMHPRYPPGATLWQYFFNAFGAPSEGKAYLAHFLLLVAPLLTLWHKARWSQPGWVVGILALVLLAIANFGLGVSILYVDHLVGLWFLGTLLAAVVDEQLASRRLALYAAPLAATALFKDAGLAFAVCGAGVLAALVFSRLLTSQETRSANVRKTVAALAVLLAPALLCSQTWAWNRDAAGAAQDVQSVGGIASGIAAQATAAKSERDAEIGRRLAEVFFDQQISNSQVTWNFNEFTYGGNRKLFKDSYRLTTFTFLVAFVAWWAALAYGAVDREARRQWLVLAVGMLATALAYLASLHLSYRFAFGELAIELPSYLRYVNVVVLPMLLLSFCPLLPAFRGGAVQSVWRVKSFNLPRRAAIYVAAVLALYVLETPYLRPIVEPNRTHAVRAGLTPLIEDIRLEVGTSRLWIYYTADSPNGFLGRMVKFLLTPTPTSLEGSERFLESDAASIAAAWRGYDYIWIASPLTTETAAGLGRFSGGVTTAPLYRILASPSGDIALQPMGERQEVARADDAAHTP